MSKKLLLADDSVTIQKVIQITFAHEDYELTITDNGDTAFEKAKELQPDLVLADVYMPGKNGYELCTALKQDPACRAVPVLLLAGSFEPFDEDKARAVKADGWLEKPFESQSLIDKVAELMAAAPAPAVEAPPAPVAEEPAPAEPAVEEFGDFAFDEETLEEEPVVAPEVADDWSDVDAFVDEDVAEPVPEVTATPIEETDFAAEAATVTPTADEEVFVFEDEPEEELPPIAASEPAAFGSIDEDVMSLGDDDILGSEDLEPLGEEPTLAAWSRDDFVVEAEEDVFAADEEEVTPEPVAEEVSFAAEEPLPVETPEPAAVDAFAEMAPEPEVAPVEPVAVAQEPVEEVFVETAPVAEEVAAVSAEDVEAKVSALSEAELEAIVEKVAGRVIEQLAGTVLEKIAWEVVPDLAETLIKEEISKIKEAAA